MKRYLTKQTILSILFILIFTLPVAAQNPNDKKKSKDDRWKEYIQNKKDYIIKETGMSKAESDKFFPLYDEMLKKKFDIQRDLRKKLRSIDNSKENIPSSVYLETVDAINKSKEDENKLDIEYTKKFKEILPPKKLYKYQKAEMNFFKDLMGDRKSVV